MAQKTYIGKGSIYADSGTTGLIPLGNCSKLSVSIDEETKEMLDYENAGGGVLNSISRVTGVKLGITCHNFIADNLALAVRGGATARASATITDEALTAKKGALITTTRLIDSAQPVVVTNDAGTATYASGADYVVKGGGIFITSTSAIADGSTIKIDYSALTDSLLQALTQSSVVFRLVFDGLNEAESGKSAYFDFFKTKFKPSGFDLIGDDFAGFSLDATVVKDESKSGTGVSQYFLAKIG